MDKKTKKLELTISPEYVGSWGTWEAVREILQNGIDRESETGGKSAMRVKYNAKNRVLTVASKDTMISRSTLIMGVTDKDGKSTIGQHGEGYKLAMLVLVRLGKTVRIVNGIEEWTPSVGRSETFATDLLQVTIRKGPRDCADLVFVVGGVTAAEWKIIRRNTIRLSAPTTAYETKLGNVLTGKGYDRKLFVGGLHICTLPDKEGHRWVHGFDFRPGVIALDRDRRMVNEWEVEYKAAQMFSEVRDVPEIVRLIELGSRDVVDLTEYNSSPSVTKAVDQVFVNFVGSNGENAIPAADKSEADELNAKYHGAKVVVVGALVAKACVRAAAYEAHLAKFERREIKTPTTILKAWYEEHRDDMTARLQQAFCDELIGVSMDWRVMP